MKAILIFGLLFGLVGCATEYKAARFNDGLLSQGVWGGGYGEIQLTENGWRVDFSGNAKTSTTRAKDFSLLRAAELTIAQGYHYFSIVGSEVDIRKSHYTTPIQSNTSGSVHYYGGSGSYSQNTTISGGETHNSSSPTASIFILMFMEGEVKPDAVFKPKFLIKSIKKKYRIK